MWEVLLKKGPYSEYDDTNTKILKRMTLTLNFGHHAQRFREVARLSIIAQNYYYHDKFSELVILSDPALRESEESRSSYRIEA